MKKTLIITVVFVISWITAAELVAQEWAGSGRIKGTVTDSEGNAIKGANVFYKMHADPTIGPPAFVTDKKGRYSFLGLKGTRWLVYAEAEGYRDSEEVLSEVFSTGVSDLVELVMEKIPAEELKAIARWEANTFLKEGDALRKEGKYAAARAKYEKALSEIDPSDFPTVYAAIGGSFLSEGKVAEAKEVLAKSLAIDGEHVGSLKAMCAIVASEGNADEAEVMLSKIPADEPMDANTLLNIGMSHYNKGEADLARPLLDRCVASHPKHPQARYFRGLVLLNLGENEKAADDFETFLELAPDSSDAAQAKEFLSYLRPPAEQ